MKEYVKPELRFESFVLSQSIAACGIDVNFANTTECKPTTDPAFWDGDEVSVFDNDKGKCMLNVDGGDIQDYCYTSGSDEAGRLFNS